MSPSEQGKTWGKNRARWYSEGLRHSDYAEKVVGVMGPVVSGYSSLLDIGAGCGALCIPLGPAFENILAIDPSPAMLEELRKAARSAGVENIETEVSAWEDAEAHVGEFDVVLCANVPGVVGEPPASIRRVECHATHLVFLILGTPKNANKFYFQELWPLIYGERYPERPDYFATYTALYQMGICANVTVVDYDFDQPFRDLDEAVLFWKDHLGLNDDSQDEVLRVFLADRLEWSDNLLWARIPKQSAIIWWKTKRD